MGFMCYSHARPAPCTFAATCGQPCGRCVDNPVYKGCITLFTTCGQPCGQLPPLKMIKPLEQPTGDYFYGVATYPLPHTENAARARLGPLLGILTWWEGLSECGNWCVCWQAVGERKWLSNENSSHLHPKGVF